MIVVQEERIPTIFSLFYHNLMLSPEGGFSRFKRSWMALLPRLRTRAESRIPKKAGKLKLMGRTWLRMAKKSTFPVKATAAASTRLIS